jgi:hypothetical protein
MGPFVKLGPLRDSDIALFAGFINNWFNYHSNFSFNYLWCSIFGQENQSHQMKMICKLKKAWDQSKVDFLLVHAEVQDLHLFVCQVFRPYSKLNTY